MRGIDLLADEALGLTGRPTLQYLHDPAVIDLTWGHPDPTLLDTRAVREAADAVLTSSAGWRSLTYGYGAGPASLRDALAEHHVELGERWPADEELFVTAGTSAALQLLLALNCRDGDVVFVESPTYFLALSILRDAPIHIVGVPSDAQGIDPDALSALAGRAAANRGPKYLYLIPTHHNPTGRLMGVERRRAVVDVAVRHGLTIIEDDVYREVSWTATLPPSLWTLADGQGVIRMGSFSKTLGPGLRLGFLTAPAPVVSRLGESGVIDSGGGVNHFTASIVARMIEDRSYHRARDAAVESYADRCRALVDGLRTAGAFEFEEPTGGYFVWTRTRHDAERFIAAARSAGVACTRGSGSYVEHPDPTRFRLSFSLFEPADLARAAAILGDVEVSLPSRA